MTLLGVIFDFDGTLADTLPIFFQACREVLEPRLGRKVSDAELRRHFGPSEDGIFQRLAPDQADQCLEAYLETYLKLHHTYAVAIPGIAPMLNRLVDMGLSLAIVTGKGPRSAGISLEHLDLAKYFSLVETGSPEGERKLVSIDKVLDNWTVHAGNVAYVGDMAVDVRVAMSAGLVPLGAAWLAATRGKVLRRAGAEAVFSHPSALVDWVESRVREENPPG